MTTVLSLDDTCQGFVSSSSPAADGAVPPYCAFGAVQHSVQARLAAAMLPELKGSQEFSQGQGHGGAFVIDAEDSVIILAARYFAGRTGANTSSVQSPGNHRNSWKQSEQQWLRKGHALPAWTGTPKISMRDPGGHDRATIVAPLMAITLMALSVISLHVCRVVLRRVDVEEEQELKEKEQKELMDKGTEVVKEMRKEENEEDARLTPAPDARLPKKSVETGAPRKPTETEASAEESPTASLGPKDALEKSLEGQPVWYSDCFRFATSQDMCAIVISMILAGVHGAFMPVAFYQMDRIFRCVYMPNDDGSLPPIMAPHTKRDAEAWNVSKLYLVTALIVSVARSGSVILMSSVARRQARMCRMKIFETLLRQGPAWHDLANSSELTSRVSMDTYHFQIGLAEKPLNLVRAIVLTLSALRMAWLKDWRLTIVMSLCMPVSLYAINIASAIVETHLAVTLKDYAKAGAIVESATQMLRTVFAFNGQHLELEKYGEKLTKAMVRGNRMAVVGGFCAGVNGAIGSFAMCLGVYAGSVWILESYEEECWVSNPPFGTCLSGGTMMGAIFTVMWGFTMGLGTMPETMDGIASCKGAARRIFAIIDTPVATESQKGRKLDNLSGGLAFENLVFSYPMRQEDTALKGITLRIPPGNTYALVGTSGSGKSTLVSLILRFYEPTSGRILLDGEDTSELDAVWMRSKMALVEQEPPLFAGTIYENIAYGLVGPVVEDQVHRAAKLANAHTFISQLPQAYETEVGVRGAQLSGGQKQRIAIARSLVRDPTIIIFDEATSALDCASEKIVQDAINKLMQDKSRTLIIIAHRLSTVRNADQICVMDYGKLVEQGTHEGLLAKRGLYHTLAEAQMGEHAMKEEEHLGNDNLLNLTTETQRHESVRGNVRASSGPALPAQQLLELEVAARAAEKETKEDRLKKVKDDDLDDLTDVDPNWNQRLWTESRPEYCLYFMGVLCIAFSSLTTPWYMMHFGQTMNLFNRPPVVLVPETGEWATDFDETEISKAVSSLCLIMQFSGTVVVFFQASSFYMFQKAAEALIHRLRRMAFKAMLRQEISWHDDHPPGILSARLADQIPKIKTLVGSNIAGGCQSFLGIFFGLGLALVFSWRYTLSVLGILPLLGTGALLLSWAKFVNENLYGGLVSEALSSIKTVTAFDLEPKIMKQFRKLLEEQGALEFTASLYYGSGMGVLVGGIFLLLCLDLWFANIYISRGYMSQDRALLVFFCIFSAAMSASQAFVWLGDRTQAAEAAKKFFALIDRRPLIDNMSLEGKQPAGGELGAHSSARIEFENVHFCYPSRPDAPVFKGISLVLEPNTVTAFVGPSGAGKSTAVALLMRFYDPQHGVIRFNGDDIVQLKISWLRKQMGLVQQEPVLFTGTILDNIRYGCAGVDDADVMGAARAANAHAFVCNLPEQYLTDVGSRGAQMSGGQKQRIAIARALVRKPSVLLLDEATAALDTASERQVQEALDELLKDSNHTTLIIAHRLSTIQGADEICVINEGQIEQKGTHQELLKEGGLYSELIQSQQLVKSKGKTPEPPVAN